MSKIARTQKMGVSQWRATSCATIHPEIRLGWVHTPSPALWWQVLGCVMSDADAFIYRKKWGHSCLCQLRYMKSKFLLHDI